MLCLIQYFWGVSLLGSARGGKYVLVDNYKIKYLQETLPRTYLIETADEPIEPIPHAVDPGLLFL